MLFWEPSQVCLSLGYFLISVGTFSVLQVLGDRLAEVMHLHLLTSIYMWREGGFSFTFSASEFHYFAYSAQVVRLRPSLDSLWEVICMWKGRKCIHFHFSYLNHVNKVLLGQGLYVASCSPLSQVDQRQEGAEKRWTTSEQGGCTALTKSLATDPWPGTSPSPRGCESLPLAVENTATTAEISYYICVHRRVTETKIKAHLLVQSWIASLAIKRRVFCFVIDHFFWISDFPFTLFLLSASWILVFIILFIGLWNLCARVSILRCSLHILCCMCQEICWWKTLNMKHIQRAWACMMCENQIPVKSHTLDD